MSHFSPLCSVTTLLDALALPVYIALNHWLCVWNETKALIKYAIRINTAVTSNKSTVFFSSFCFLFAFFSSFVLSFVCLFAGRLLAIVVCLECLYICSLISSVYAIVVLFRLFVLNITLEITR